MQAHVTPDEFLREIEKLIEDAAETDDWKPVAAAFQRGLETNVTRISTFCLLARLILRRFFVLRESDEKVHEFLVTDLHMDSQKAIVVRRMAVEAAKKATEIAAGKKDMATAVVELERDVSAEPEVAMPLIEMASDFFMAAAPGGFGRILRALFVASIILLSSPRISVPIAIVGWLALCVGGGFRWWSAGLVALAFFVGTLVLGVFVLQRLRGAVLGPRDPLK